MHNKITIEWKKKSNSPESKKLFFMTQIMILHFKLF